MAMTEKDTLLYGVEYPAGSGQMHYDFELRLPTVGDNIVAIEELGVGSNLRLNTAMLARALVRLGDIPSEAITYELLDKELVDDDYDVLATARDRLKKKPDPAEAHLPAFRPPAVPPAKPGTPGPRTPERPAAGFEGYLAAVNRLYGGKLRQGDGSESRRITSQRRKKPA